MSGNHSHIVRTEYFFSAVMSASFMAQSMSPVGSKASDLRVKMVLESPGCRTGIEVADS